MQEQLPREIFMLLNGLDNLKYKISRQQLLALLYLLHPCSRPFGRNDNLSEARLQY